MFAIIEIGGKQYKVKENDVLRIEKVDPETAQVLLVSDGEKTHIGTPVVSGAKVAMTVINTGKNDKVNTIKMKAKKRYKRTKNHRQTFNEVKVGAITLK